MIKYLSSSEFQEDNPMRPLAWRWQRAWWIVSHHQNFSRRRDDAATRRIVAYLRARGRRGRVVRSVRTKQFADIRAACEINECGDSTRLVLQARILARQSSVEISQTTGVPADTVDAFEAMFFHCRDRLTAADWIATQAIRKTAAGLPETKAGAGLKTFAYHGGPVVLDAVLPYFLGGRDIFERALDLSTPEGRREHAARLAVASWLVPDDERSRRKLTRIMMILQDRGSSQQVSAPSPSPTGNFAEMLFARAMAGVNSLHPEAPKKTCEPEASPRQRQIA